jgi:hypothetical protein
LSTESQGIKNNGRNKSTMDMKGVQVNDCRLAVNSKFNQTELLSKLRN